MASEDPHFSHGVLEMNIGQGNWLSIRDDLAAQGTIPKIQRSASLRLTVYDFAGNNTISQQWQVPTTASESPSMTTPEANLAQELPDPSEPADEATTRVPDQAATVETPPTGDTTPQSQSQPQRPVVPPNHQAIIAPHAGQTFDLPTETPQRTLIPKKVTHNEEVQTASQGSLQDPIAHTSSPASSGHRQILHQLQGASIIVRPRSERGLAAAQAALSAGDTDVAISLLHVLLNSDLSDQAAAQLIQTYQDQQRPTDFNSLLTTLPPEAVTSLVAVTAARRIVLP